MPDTPNYSFYRKPRFSVNHLAAYLGARTAPKRAEIIRDAKFPRKPAVIAYKGAKGPICHFMGGGSGDPSYFDTLLNNLAAKAAREEGYARDEALRCHEAILAFLRVFKSSRMKKYSFTPGPIDLTFPLVGVSINTRLDAGVIERSADGDMRGGGCVLFFAATAQTRRNIEDRRKYVAATIYWALQQSGQMQPLPRLCMSFDVFGDTIEKATTSHERLRENMSGFGRT